MQDTLLRVMALLVAIPIAIYAWVVAGPPPLEIHSMALEAAVTVQRGQTAVFRTASDKTWWAVRFCTATSGLVNSVDAAGTIRQAAIVGVNYNDGRFHGALVPVMITTGMAPGEATFQIVGTYQCLGVARTVYGPVVKAVVE